MGKSLNAEKGKTISDLEAVLLLMDKMVQSKLNEKPKAGVTLCKGAKSERRLKYAEAKELVDSLLTYFGMKGCFSFGICGTCTAFDTRSHGNEDFGTCKVSRNTVHRFETCSEHSKKGGGFGL